MGMSEAAFLNIVKIASGEISYPVPSYDQWKVVPCLKPLNCITLPLSVVVFFGNELCIINAVSIFVNQ